MTTDTADRAAAATPGLEWSTVTLGWGADERKVKTLCVPISITQYSPIVRQWPADTWIVYRAWPQNKWGDEPLELVTPPTDEARARKVAAFLNQYRGPGAEERYDVLQGGMDYSHWHIKMGKPKTDAARAFVDSQKALRPKVERIARYVSPQDKAQQARDRATAKVNRQQRETLDAARAQAKVDRERSKQLTQANRALKQRKASTAKSAKPKAAKRLI